MAFDEFEPRPAQRRRAYLKIAISGPGGGGKTLGALAIATGLAMRVAAERGDPRNYKLLGVDTENGTMGLYADEYPFQHIIFNAPYTSDRYISAMQRGVRDKYDAMAVDSLSHQWAGSGGIMDRKDKLDSGGGNQFSNWKELSPEHTDFIEFIKALPIHLIVTMRSKQEYILVDDDRGKKKPVKLGLAPIQRDGVDYEFSFVFDLDGDTKRARIMKDRARIAGKPVFAQDERVDLTDPSIVDRIWAWYTSGADMVIEKMTETDTFEIAAAMKGKVSREEFAAWLKQSLGYDSIKDVPRNRMREIMTYISTPAVVSNAEKIARQSMKSLGFTPADVGACIGKHRGNWDAINRELENQSLDQRTSFDPATESQDPFSQPRTTTDGADFPPEDSTDSTESTIPHGEIYSYTSPDLIINVQDVVRRNSGNKEFMVVTLPVPIEGFTQAVCWHGSRFAALSNAADQNCHLQVKVYTPKKSESQPSLQIEEVLRVGLTEYEYIDGKHRIKKAA